MSGNDQNCDNSTSQENYDCNHMTQMTQDLTCCSRKRMSPHVGRCVIVGTSTQAPPPPGFTCCCCCTRTQINTSYFFKSSESCGLCGSLAADNFLRRSNITAVILIKNVATALARRKTVPATTTPMINSELLLESFLRPALKEREREREEIRVRE